MPSAILKGSSSTPSAALLLDHVDIKLAAVETSPASQGLQIDPVGIVADKDARRPEPLSLAGRGYVQSMPGCAP